LTVALKRGLLADALRTIWIDMLHRHLNHERFTLAAIDDVIARGRRADWEELRKALLADRSLAGKIVRVCQPHLGDGYAQRYHFWNHYVQERFA
jgi:hypothetical protein